MIAFDAFSVGTAGTGALSHTHTPVDAPRGVVVFVVSAGGTDEVSGVTYGGVPLSERSSISPNLLAGGEGGSVYTYFLGSSIPAGPQSVVVSVSGASLKIAACVTVVAGGDVDVQEENGTINSASQANPSVVLDPGGAKVFVAEAFYSGQDATSGIAPLAGWTARHEEDLGTETAGFYTYDTVAGVPVTAGWSQTVEDAVMCAVALVDTQAPPPPPTGSPLYLRSTAQANPAPFISRSLGLPAGSEVTIDATPRMLATTKGVAVTSVSGAGLAITGHQDNLLGIWTSPALDTQKIPAGAWSVLLSCNEADAWANSFLSVALYLYRPSAGTAVIRIFDADVPLGTEWDAGHQNTRGGTFDGAEAPGVIWGDVLVLEIWRHARQSAAIAPTQTVYFNGGTDLIVGDLEADAASVLLAPATLLFASGEDPFAFQGAGRTYGKHATMEPWYICAICGQRFTRSETVLLKSPNIRAGMRVCTRYCLDEPDFLDRLRTQQPIVGRDEHYRGDE